MFVNDVAIAGSSRNSSIALPIQVLNATFWLPNSVKWVAIKVGFHHKIVIEAVHIRTAVIFHPILSLLGPSFTSKLLVPSRQGQSIRNETRNIFPRMPGIRDDASLQAKDT